ncbi:MAG: membrane protein insertase YidC [Desulfobacteraceae bacterium]|nr:membrane protein insertase YidC [Desulfobacteraceae bacterium]
MDQEIYRIVLVLVLSGCILFSWQYYQGYFKEKPLNPVKVIEKVEKPKTNKTIRKDLSVYENCGRLKIIVFPLYKTLEFLNKKTGNLGIALIFLTLGIRTLLSPLMLKQMQSSKKMKTLQGDIKKIKTQYSENPIEMQKAVGELFKDNCVNPLGSIGLLIIQIPFFFALYKIVREAHIFSGASLGLWVQDLGVADPYFILPIIAGIIMFLDSLFQGTTGSQMPKGLIYVFPIFFACFLLNQPAGLALYFLVGNIVQLGFNITTYKPSRITGERL